jgi:DNA-binding transcriptional ArsR family regulator
MHDDSRTQQLLEQILAVLKLAHGDSIQKQKEQILRGLGSNKRKVYDLCDGNRTVNIIASEAGLSQPNVSQHLASLLESGLVLYKEEAGKKYYYKTLE